MAVKPQKELWTILAPTNPEVTELTGEWILIDTTKREDCPKEKFGLPISEVIQEALPEEEKKLHTDKAPEADIRMPKVMEYTIIANRAHPEWLQSGYEEWFSDYGYYNLAGGGLNQNNDIIVKKVDPDKPAPNRGYRTMIVFPNY